MREQTIESWFSKTLSTHFILYLINPFCGQALLYIDIDSLFESLVDQKCTCALSYPTVWKMGKTPYFNFFKLV